MHETHAQIGSRRSPFSLRVVFSLTSLWMLAGCGMSLESVTNVEDYQIDGMAADQYYSQFLYKKADTNHGPEYSFLCAGGKISQSSSEGVRYQLDIILRENHTYSLKYLEYSNLSLDPAIEKNLTGTWERKELHLLLSKVGKGSGVTINGSQKVALMITRSADTQGIAPEMPILGRCTTNQPLEN